MSSNFALRGHIRSLDGLRGIAILMVLAHHFISMEHSPGRLAHLIGSVTRSLWCGVDLFFVLSGFLVTRVLLAARSEPQFYRNFYIRRALRIFPLYYTVIIGTLLLSLSHHAPKSIGIPDSGRYYVALLLYVTNFVTLSASWRGLGTLFVFWSLAVEEHFYLVWPILVRSLRRRWLLGTCILLVFTALALRAALVRLGAPPIAVYSLTFCRIDALAVGGAVCLLISRSQSGGQTWVRRGHALAAASGAFLGLIVWRSKERLLDPHDPVVQLIGYTLLAVLMGGVLIVAVCGNGRRGLAWVCDLGTLRWFGKYSYGIYVFHTMALAWVNGRFSGSTSGNPAHSLLFGILRPVVGTSLAVGCAWLSYHLFESYFLRQKKRLAPVHPQELPRDRNRASVDEPAAAPVAVSG